MPVTLARPDTATVSHNFAVAKVLCILIVAAGHYFEGSLLWIPATVALFVFGFSSGYFTAQRYRSRFSVPAFWRAKILRLVPAILLIDAVLLALFVYQDRAGIWTVESLIAALGLSGWLNWLGLPNPGPYGAGLWFFTLLLMFYLAYPVLRMLTQSDRGALAVALVGLAATTALHYTVDVGHMLWPTVFAFLLGSVAGGRRWPGAGLLHLATCLGAALTLGALNAIAGINSFNYPLILLMSVTACGVLLTLPLPRRLCAPALWFDACVLEIYFLHSYLFVRPEGLPPAAGFLMSMVIVLLVSLSVARLRARLTHGSTGQHRQQAA